MKDFLLVTLVAKSFLVSKNLTRRLRKNQQSFVNSDK
jgi:hypothetical protein